MCGFLGQFGGTIDIGHQVELRSLLFRSRSRGPDETRVYSNGTDLWMGFNRLAILDTSAAGSQPMHSNNGRYTIVYNGEIYNHLDLRRTLGDHNWRGHSDTETILAGIEHWGFPETINRLDGMFALAVYDSHEKALYCARDFAGIKPFFYGMKEGIFVFASQYDQIVTHPAFRNESIDPEVLRLFLEQHFMPAPFGMIQRTGQLEAGQWCRISATEIRKHYYWQLPEYVEPEIREKDVALELIDKELAESVAAEMLADVPLGAFLSGGIDSPLICHYAHKHSKGKLKSFTIGSDSTIHDETDDARRYSELIGTQHYNRRMSTESAFTIVDDALACLSEPMADFSILPTYAVSKLAREHVTVALSGDGGDELFFGYERFWSIAKNIRFQNWPWPLKAAIYKADKTLTNNRTVNGVLLAPGQGMAHRGLHSRFPTSLIGKLFPDLNSTQTPADYSTYAYDSTTSVERLIQSIRKAEFYGMMQKTLRKVDLASMGVSLEVRVPLLKKSFIETVLRIDPMLSYGANKKKQLLKDQLFRKHPQAPIDNKKRGFSVPLGRWIKEPGFRKPLMDRLMDPSFLEPAGCDGAQIERLISSHGNPTDRKWPIFTLVALSRFLDSRRRYNISEFAEAVGSSR